MSKAIIIYFSQSGNTKKIAEAIHRGMLGTLANCDLSRLKDVSPKDVARYDLIGFGYPTWSSKEPPNVRAFANQIDSLEGKHVFAFSTHGALPSGLISSIAPLLRQKGLKMIGFKDWYGGVIMPHIPKPYMTDGHPDEIDLEEAKNFGAEIAKLSERIYRGEDHLLPPLTEESDQKLHGQRVKMPEDLAEARRLTKLGMKINEDKCTRCNLCVDNCPVNAIDLTVSPPIFKTDLCVPCWYCEQICPTGAIEVDWELFARVHDKYNVIELNATLEIAETQGRFRRLVPFQNIKLDAHWYKQSKHPRLLVP
jgi:flavodoxin/NAD-dependent dihydropyrimidine dehydrogenase PreA subunit